MSRYKFRDAIKLVGIPFLLSVIFYGVILVRQNTNFPSKARVIPETVKYFKLISQDNQDDFFIIRVDNPEISNEIISRDNLGKRIIISGRVKKGDGGFNIKRGGYWNWHLDPDSINISEKEVNLCDAEPSVVDKNLEDWIGKTYCPSEVKVGAVYDTPVLP